MRFNTYYPLKVWLAGLSCGTVPFLLFVLVEQLTASSFDPNDFSPYFIALYTVLLLFIPLFIIFYLAFLYAARRSWPLRKVKQLLSLVTFMLFCGYGYFLQLENEVSTYLLVFPFVLSIIACIFYFQLTATDEGRSGI